MHRRELDAGHALQQRDVDMSGGAEAGTAVGDLAGLALRQRDQFGDGVGRQRRMRQQPLVDADEAGHRREVLDVVGQLAGVQRGVDDEHRLGADHHAVAVGRGLRHHGGADGMIGAAAIFDDHLLAPRGHEALRHQARHGVADAPGRSRHHDGDGPRRISLRQAGRRQPAEQAERDQRNSLTELQSIFRFAALMTFAHFSDSFFR